MRNLLAFLAAVAITFAGVGWYLGWYKVESVPAADPGHHKVTIEVDTKQIDADIHKGKEKVRDALDKGLKEETPKTAANNKDETSKQPTKN